MGSCNILITHPEEMKRLKISQNTLNKGLNAGSLEVNLKAIDNTRVTLTRERDVVRLIKLGKIGKSSLYRFRERGWVMMNYHKIQQRNTFMSESDVCELYKYIIVVCNNFLQKHSKLQAYSFTLDELLHDITHDVIVILLKRKPKKNEGLKMVFNLIKQVIRGNDLYIKYIRWI